MAILWQCWANRSTWSCTRSNRSVHCMRQMEHRYVVGCMLGVYTLRLRPNGRYFPDDIFKHTLLNENVLISIKMSLKFVPMGPAMVPIMAWRRPGDKPLSEPMMISLLTHIWVTRPQWVKCKSYKVKLSLKWISTYWNKKIFIKKMSWKKYSLLQYLNSYDISLNCDTNYSASTLAVVMKYFKFFMHCSSSLWKRH